LRRIIIAKLVLSRFHDCGLQMRIDFGFLHLDTPLHIFARRTRNLNYSAGANRLSGKPRM
jgi:hypothetical protein